MQKPILRLRTTYVVTSSPYSLTSNSKCKLSKKKWRSKSSLDYQNTYNSIVNCSPKKTEVKISGCRAFLSVFLVLAGWKINREFQFFGTFWALIELNFNNPILVLVGHFFLLNLNFEFTVAATLLNCVKRSMNHV